MKCAVDDLELNMADRQGVEIDYCPKCCGVWLDRGELDKIIQRSLRKLRDDDRDDEDPRWDRDEHRGYRVEKRRRRSFLRELFDGFD